MNYTDFNKLFDALRENTYYTKQDNYPFYSVKRNKKTDEAIFEVALAGFSKEEIDISFEGNRLRIEAEPKNIGGCETEDSDFEVFSGNLARRKAVREFILNNKYINSEEMTANFENGILKITIAPKKDFTKKIEIK